MERFYNVSDQKAKRIRIGIICGIDRDDDFITSNFDLIQDSKHLLSIIQNKDDDSLGFIVEVSNFNEGEYDNNGLGENEFHPLKYYFVGIELPDAFLIGNTTFSKCLPVEMVKDSRELNQKLLSIVYDGQKYDVETIANMYKETPKSYEKVS